MEHCIEKITFVLCIAAAAYGATIGPMGFRDGFPNTFQSQLNRGDYVEDVPLSPNHIALAEPETGFELGTVIVQAIRTVLDIFRRMELTEESLKSLMQMISPLLVTYFGQQSQLVLPVLTGLATALIRSLAAA